MASTPASMFHIVTTGLQDLERLNAPKGNPTIRFYSAVFLRRSRWASQWRRVEFDNMADFGKKATVTLPQLGELISRVILVVTLPDLYGPQDTATIAGFGETGLTQLIGPTWNWTNSIGHALCSSMELQIGDQVIDRVDSRLMEILDEQTRPVEHFDTTNSMIGRKASGYTSTVSKQPVSVEIVPPFWFNRGPGPQVFPIQALAKDKVQITVNFRPIQQCVYTDARIDPRNPPLSSSQGPGPLPNIAGCGFFVTGGETSQPIYNMTQNYFGFGPERTNSPLGSLLPGYTMPASYHFRDAYWIVEYISLEDREAAAFRMADLQIPIEQHVAVPPVDTGGAASLRIPLNEVGLVRDMTWVAQRVEAPGYNAYFLFSRDLGPPGVTGISSFLPWWPDAVIPLWDYGDGYVQPAFVTRQSDPIKAATLWYRGQRRFDHEAPSFFRSLIPLLNCTRTPLINRYIYRYEFGFWSTGGIADALTKPVDQVRGFSNWDKIPKKELDLTFDLGPCSSSWINHPDQAPVTFTEMKPLNELLTYLPAATAAVQIDLSGSVGPGLYGGAGATVRGILNLQQLRSIPNFKNVIARVVPGGSASLALQTFDGTSFGYQWLAVAGAGGAGSSGNTGGDAGSAIAIAMQGGNGLQTHDASGSLAEGSALGGGGGGRGATLGPGLPDGTQMSVNESFVLSTQQTGGTLYECHGGDGYTGGGSGSGSGSGAGGGGGSYVSRYMSGVQTEDGTSVGPASITITPLVSIQAPRPNFAIYAWMTTYNMLRITGGRGALLFSA